MISEGSHSGKSVVKGRAAAYLKTPMYWYPTIPRVLMVVLPVEILTLVLFPDVAHNRLYWIAMGITVPFVAWFLVYWRVYQSVFVTRKPVSSEPISPRWKPFTFGGWGNESLKAYLVESDEGSEDLLLYLHGYNSRMSRGESRSLHFHRMGLNVISLDQRGFGTQGKRHDWTLLKVIADIEGLLDHTPMLLGFTPRRLWIYGHSMGGFLTIRLASHPSSWWEGALKAIILESPAASFPKIIDSKLPGRAVMAKPWVRHILRREHERIHPDLNIRYANAELPYSGIPKVPALVIQSENDETLGNKHFDLIQKHMSHISEIHVLDMPHTSTVDTNERRELVEKWMKNQLELTEVTYQ